jgi:glycosyltransferase involved in cell wall biosynthesis
VRSVSVIVPAFNAEKTLAETLRSVAAQTRPADEVIVVDDGSADATADIAAAVPGVRVLRHGNAGTGGALNAGLRAARHALLAFLDADDLWDARCLEVHLSHLERLPQPAASVGWVAEFVCPSLSSEAAARFRPRPPQAGWLSGATLVGRPVFERAGDFNPALRSQAWMDWAGRARQAGVHFGVVRDTVLRRRLHPDSLSVSARAQGRAGMLDVVKLSLARRRAHAAGGAHE